MARTPRRGDPPSLAAGSIRHEGDEMPYIEGRVVHDADAHIMEPPTWLGEHADPGIR